MQHFNQHMINNYCMVSKHHWYSRCAFPVKLSASVFVLQRAGDSPAPPCVLLPTLVPFPPLNVGSLSRHVAAASPGGPALISLQLINFISPSHRACLQEFSLALQNSVALHTADDINRLNIALKPLAPIEYLSDTHAGVLWSYHFMQMYHAGGGYHMWCTPIFNSPNL